VDGETSAVVSNGMRDGSQRHRSFSGANPACFGPARLGAPGFDAARFGLEFLLMRSVKARYSSTTAF